MGAKLDLADVTLCAADSANMALTARAMHISMEKCKFGDAVFFSHAPVEGNYRTVKIDKVDRDGYQAFRKKPPPTVETPFVLFIEWDGYVIEPRAWSQRFREYDFIGAKWPPMFLGVDDGMNVGNSGFCLQSKKFNEKIEPIVLGPGENVDLAVCKRHRRALERDFGIRFAPEPVADLFSYEFVLPRKTTFGFHGLGNMWRHNSDLEMLEIIDLVDPYVLATKQFTTLLAHYSLQCKFHMIERLFIKMRQHIDRDAALAIFRRDFKPPHGDAIFGLCEQLVVRP